MLGRSDIWYRKSPQKIKKKVLRGLGWLSRSEESREKKAWLVSWKPVRVHVCGRMWFVCAYFCALVRWQHVFFFFLVVVVDVCALIAGRFEPGSLPPARWNCHQNMKVSKHQTGPLIVCVSVCACVELVFGVMSLSAGLWLLVHVSLGLRQFMYFSRWYYVFCTCDPLFI